MNRALFLDRDGVINIEKTYLYKIEDFVFIEGVFETLRCFQKLGYLLIIITNQAGIGRGYYTEEDFHVLNSWMTEQFKKKGVYISNIYYSPFHPVSGVGKYKKDSYCRKPNPGMIFQAKKDFNIDLSESILVGDKESDIETGINAGIKTNILVKSGHKVDINNTKSSFVKESIRDLMVIYGK